MHKTEDIIRDARDTAKDAIVCIQQILSDPNKVIASAELSISDLSNTSRNKEGEIEVDPCQELILSIKIKVSKNLI